MTAPIVSVAVRASVAHLSAPPYTDHTRRRGVVGLRRLVERLDAYEALSREHDSLQDRYDSLLRAGPSPYSTECSAERADRLEMLDSRLRFMEFRLARLDQQITGAAL